MCWFPGEQADFWPKHKGHIPCHLDRMPTVDSSMNIPDSKLPRIVIVGGGFGGLKLAMGINSNFAQIVLVDRNSYHTFQPLMYQVATAGLEPDSIAYPIRKVFRNKRNFFFRLANVNRIDVANKMIHADIGTLKFEYLVIATGAVTN